MSGTQISTVGRAVTSAQPYAWPYHGQLEPSRCAMVACVDPAWRVTGPQSDTSDQLMRELAAALREAGGLVIAVTSMPMRRPAGAVGGSGPVDVGAARVDGAAERVDGAAERVDGAAERVDGAAGSVGGHLGRPAWPTGLAAEVEVESGGTSAFYESRLDSILQRGGYHDLILVGWGLEGPVHSTMRAANDSGYECLLVADACTSLAPELAFAACEMVRFSGGIFGAFADTADVVQTLAGCAVSSPPIANDRSAA